MNKAVIFAPFWRQVGHVGNNRVDRFVRWLAADGYHVVMIRAGSAFGQIHESWGTEITVRDPMGLYRDASSTGVPPQPRNPNKLRRALAYWLFNPDPGVVWANAAALHPVVLEAASGAAFILSSNPPESAHVGAWKLARSLNLPHIVDMRDGWLDEPLKPSLRTSAFRQWREGRLESRILRNAVAVQVTSDLWQELLLKRFPCLLNKVTVLTNGYPKATPLPQSSFSKKVGDDLLLIHAGKFSGSDTRRTPDLLLGPLLQNLSSSKNVGVIRFIGPLSQIELVSIESFKQRFSQIGWQIDCPGNISRDKLLNILSQADGLLLLSTSNAAIPSKLFEYIATGRPIFIVTKMGSSTWHICEKLPQALLYDASGMIRLDTLSVSFFSQKKIKELDHSKMIPEIYTEISLRDKFRKNILHRYFS